MLLTWVLTFFSPMCRLHAAAFALRDAPYVMNMVAEWNANEVHEAEKHMHWVRTFQAAIQAFIAKGVYSYFLGDEGETQARPPYPFQSPRPVPPKIPSHPPNLF